MRRASPWRSRTVSPARATRPRSCAHPRRSRFSPARGSRRSRSPWRAACRGSTRTRSAGRPRRRSRTAPCPRLSPAYPRSRWTRSSPAEGTIEAAMAATFDSLIDDLERSYKDVQERMSDPAVYNDHREAADVGRRLKELEGPYKLAQDWRSARADLVAAREDPDLRELVPELEERTAGLEEELRLAMAPSDPADRKDVIVEIRQGEGGDEAALWAGDLYRMLTRYAERRGFKVEDLASSPNDGAGFKEVAFAVKGDGAYSVFKWEGGTHRVH